MVSVRQLIAAAALTAATTCGTAQAQTQLKVIVFPGLSNLMQIVAQTNGYYAKRGLAV